MTRHPARPDIPAIRVTRVWDPRELGGPIDFDEVEAWLRGFCKGRCPIGHPATTPARRCQHCAGGVVVPPRYWVRKIVFDPHQMHSMAQRLQRERIAWFEEFGQGEPRLRADGHLHSLALQGQLAHDGNEILRSHVLSAAAKIYRDEESSIRIVKRSPRLRIDAAVAASMAVYEAMHLRI